LLLGGSILFAHGGSILLTINTTLSAKILCDPVTRKLAIAIKNSGGLLIQGLPNQLGFTKPHR